MPRKNFPWISASTRRQREKLRQSQTSSQRREVEFVKVPSDVYGIVQARQLEEATARGISASDLASIERPTCDWCRGSELENSEVVQADLCRCGGINYHNRPETSQSPSDNPENAEDSSRLYLHNLFCAACNTRCVKWPSPDSVVNETCTNCGVVGFGTISPFTRTERRLPTTLAELGDDDVVPTFATAESLGLSRDPRTREEVLTEKADRIDALFNEYLVKPQPTTSTTTTLALTLRTLKVKKVEPTCEPDVANKEKELPTCKPEVVLNLQPITSTPGTPSPTSEKRKKRNSPARKAAAASKKDSPTCEPESGLLPPASADPWSYAPVNSALWRARAAHQKQEVTRAQSRAERDADQRRAVASAHTAYVRTVIATETVNETDQRLADLLVLNPTTTEVLQYLAILTASDSDSPSLAPLAKFIEAKASAAEYPAVIHRILADLATPRQQTESPIVTIRPTTCASAATETCPAAEVVHASTSTETPETVDTSTSTGPLVPPGFLGSAAEFLVDGYNQTDDDNNAADGDHPQSDDTISLPSDDDDNRVRRRQLVSRGSARRDSSISLSSSDYDEEAEGSLLYTPDPRSFGTGYVPVYNWRHPDYHPIDRDGA